MSNVDEAIRGLMQERAESITSAPPLPETLIRSRGRRRRVRRRAVVLAVAAVLALGAGVALSQMLENPEPPTITPTSERFVVASGDSAEGPWQLTAYRAELEGQWRTDGGYEYGVRPGWCLDLDGPAVDEGARPPTQYANICSLTEDMTGPIEPIGATVRIPDFRAGDAFAFGEVSPDVVTLEMGREGGLQVEATIVRAPASLSLPVDYFFAFVPGRGNVDILARDETGRVLEEQRL
jgi:hypothetical protein